MHCYAAGGVIRDLLLGYTVQDADFVFDIPEEEFLQMNPEARKTKSGLFPIYMLHGQEYTPLVPNVSIAPHSKSRFQENLLKRDFTINALLLSDTGILHCLPQTLADLKSKTLRPASASAIHDDPARAFRAARFAATLQGLCVHEDTLAQMRAVKRAKLEDIAAERIAGEVLKACRGRTPGKFVELLHEGGCLDFWFAEFARAAHIPAGPQKYHGNETVLSHTANIMNAVAHMAGKEKEEDRQLAVWMALCHDLGKSTTPSELLPKHIGHEDRGAAMALALGERLAMPKRFIKAGLLAAREHMKGGTYFSLRPGTRVDLILLLANNRLLTPFSLLCAADSGRHELPAVMQRDLHCILEVTLPHSLRNKGEFSGKRLRELRCEALVVADS
ncbi:HD domain-containing protein [Desulfovibrio sp. OttesenSCG-928-G15]|nr:HD domain-containing protein [Desulfovibrio sp. OttesenSCG-928-G15]